MKILFVCNVMLPSIASHLGVQAQVFGGWLSGHIDNLKKNNSIKVVVTFPYDQTKHYVCGATDGIKYYSFKKHQKSKELQNRFEQIFDIEKPDIVHIFGTEYEHSLDAINAAETRKLLNNTIISIQGLVSVYSKHYIAALDYKIIKKRTLRDVIKRSNILKLKYNFLKSGEKEIQVLKKCKNIIGRTDWDEACVKRINPDVKYFFCNENLRESFYSDKWSLQNCEKHSIFVSSCAYPIKGFHLILEAFSDVVKKYPDAHLYTVGQRKLEENGFLANQKLPYYIFYIKKLIKKYNLEKKVTFLNFLDEKHMKERFLSSNVFVLPSSIENSPNSLGEAMILGVPCVASDVGGVKNMLKHGEEGYVYPYDEPYMAAYYISKIFDDEKLAQDFSIKAKKHAEHTHNIDINIMTSIDIYNEVMK